MAQYDSTIGDSLKAAQSEIRAAHLPRARQILRALAPSSLPRRHVTLYAELCRRSGLLPQAIRAIGPLVQNARGLNTKALAAERLEYAALLIQLGLSEEGRRLLSSLDAEEHPRTSLFLAFSWIKEWNYLEAIAPMRAYLRGKLTEYERLVGEVNLLACLVHNIEAGDPASNKEAETLSNKLLQITSAPAQQRLHSNVAELRTQMAFFGGRYLESLKELGRLRLTRKTEITDLDDLFLAKWESFSRAMMNGDAKPLRILRTQAIKLGHAETLRECDLYEGIVLGEEALLQKVYRGTPHLAYKERVERLVLKHHEAKFVPRSEIFWSPGKAGGRCLLKSPKNVVDLDSLDASLGPSSVILKSFHALCCDFYAVFRSAQLFARIFENQIYLGDSSKNALNQVLFRGKRVLQNHKGLSIEFSEGGYRWNASETLYLRLKDERSPPLNRESRKLLDLLMTNKLKSFDLAQVASLTESSERSLQRHLSELCRSGHLTREGRARATRYLVK